MKYLGEETQIEVKTKSIRKVEYLRCDECCKKILPSEYRNEKSRYVRIHTWHNDWGNDSVDSHQYGDYCPECAKSFVSTYMDRMRGSEQLELENKYLYSGETYEGYDEYDDNYYLVKKDLVK